MAFRRPATPATEVADYLLWLSRRDDQPLDNLKIQKLLYYIQSWSLIEDGSPVFRDNIEAWPLGPVCYEVYKRFEGSGSSRIDTSEVDRPKVLDHVAEIAEQIWSRYGSLSGTELAAMTHHEDPWVQAREGLGDKVRSKREVTLESAHKYFSDRLDRENARLAALMKSVIEDVDDGDNPS